MGVVLLILQPKALGKGGGGRGGCAVITTNN